jgi:hypothetical protein
MKVKIEIELEGDYSTCHFTDDQMKEILFKYPERISKVINDPHGELYFNGMALGSVRVKKADIISYSLR